MPISVVGSALPLSKAASSTPANSTQAPAVDYNEFLQLLVAELQHQDPTAPTDPTQYMSQLASFSSVEQQITTNGTLDALLSAQAGSIIGKLVASSDGSISGIVTSVQLQANGAIANLDNGKQIVLGTGVTVRSP
jgi:flagellar basal-body rod modification protein FlgD